MIMTSITFPQICRLSPTVPVASRVNGILGLFASKGGGGPICVQYQWPRSPQFPQKYSLDPFTLVQNLKVFHLQDNCPQLCVSAILSSVNTKPADNYIILHKHNTLQNQQKWSYFSIILTFSHQIHGTSYRSGPKIKNLESLRNFWCYWIFWEVWDFFCSKFLLEKINVGPL